MQTLDRKDAEADADSRRLLSKCQGRGPQSPSMVGEGRDRPLRTPRFSIDRKMSKTGLTAGTFDATGTQDLWGWLCLAGRQSVPLLSDQAGERHGAGRIEVAEHRC